MSAVLGVSLEGFHTTALPQASAGKIFHEGIARGKFHGVIIAATPTGLLTVVANLDGNSEGAVCVKSLLVSEAA